MNQSQAINFYLKNDPLIQKCSARELAQLVSVVELETLSVDEVVFTPAQKTEYIYYILAGEINLYTPDKKIVTLGKGNYFGQEAGFQALSYAGQAVVKTPAILLKIPAQPFEDIMNRYPEIRTNFLFSMLKDLSQLRFLSKLHGKDHKPDRASGFYTQYQQLIGWCLALILPILSYMAFSKVVANASGLAFISFLSAAFIMWIFELVDAYVAGILLLLSGLALGIAPPGVILSGFSSEVFFMALGILALGSVLTHSGILYRLLLYILKYLPPTQFWSNVSIFFLGIMMTIAVPVALNRAEVITPFLNEFASQTKVHPGGRAATKLALSSLFSISLFSSIFLSGSLHNFMLLGLLWAQDQERFQWWGWLQATAVPAFVILIGFTLPLCLFFRSKEKLPIDRSRIEDQLRTLGLLNRGEKFALLYFFIFMVGVMTQDFHRTSPQLVGLLILLTLLIFNVINKAKFQNFINWPALFLLGSLIGIINLFNYLSLNSFLIEKLDWLGWYIKHDFQTFIMILIITITVVRLVIPYGPTVVILGTVFIPLAQQYEVNPWTVAFLVLLIGKMWFYPSQYPPYQEFKKLIASKGFFNKNALLIYNVYMNFIKILAIYAAIPYWKNLGVL